MIDAPRTNAQRNHAVMLAVTTALATTVLAGCSTAAAPLANVTAGKAQNAPNTDAATPAIAAAQDSALAAPQDAGARSDLGARYMEAGRFASAAASFKDAMDLGDDSGRTALSYALAQTAAGDPATARSVLDQNRSEIAAADLGLALALAGDPDQGVHLLGNAIRNGENTAKTRQNLAYAYALQGNWRAARLMVAEDVPADQVGDRIGEWSKTIQPGQEQHRIARLLNVPLVNDAGRPAMLALSSSSATSIPATSAVKLPALAKVGELPALAGGARSAPEAVRNSVPKSLPEAVAVSTADEPFTASRAAPAQFASAQVASAQVASTQYALPKLAQIGAAPVTVVQAGSALVSVDPTPRRVVPIASTIAAPAGPLKTAGPAKFAASELAAIGSGTETELVKRSANLLPATANAVPAAAALKTEAPKSFAQAFSAAMPKSAPAAIPAPAALERLASATANFVASPTVQQAAVTPAPVVRPSSKPEAPVVAATQKGRHLVQLGSFTSEAQAKRAWGVYEKEYPQLRDFDMVITTAEVRGKTYFRVSAGGLAKAEANSVCSTVKAKGQGCITWASAKPLPGSISREARLARR